eukprot:TRINITY_DN3153_c0_g1_i1.p1 TRINITY_DN3153_c0_g1~~TRINITY_DN3153_c0_g1_i1.p1  ORF type:complete len:300 (-),score=78.20 TRINITY_DN3153_c0_g1_i1:216-1115(-)
MFKALASVLFATLAVSVSARTVPGPGDPAPWTPVDWHTLPKASDADMIQVLYLVAPLLETDFGKWLGYAHAYHAAIGFINLNTGFNITINYDADDFFRATLFPVINEKTKELTFENQGANFIYMGINQTYWEEEMTLVGTINGSVWNNYISGFNAKFNATYPYYNLLEVVNRNSTVYVPSLNCFDFMWFSLWNLYDQGIQYVPNLTLKSNYANIYSNAMPEDVTQQYLTNATVHERVFQFYELLEAKVLKLGFKELLAEIVFVFKGDFYLRTSNTLYLIKLEYPYIDLLWAEKPLPGQS